MKKVKIKETGEMKEVTDNVAFDLIDRGIAELAGTKAPKKELQKEYPYTNRQMRSKIKK
jgi:hypothetical protein